MGDSQQRQLAALIEAAVQRQIAAQLQPVTEMIGVSSRNADAIANAQSPLLQEMLQRLINIERKTDAVVGRLEGRRFDGHPDQAFGGSTYAQFGEDLIILNVFSMLGVTHPTYLDIGAHHPYNISNTALLHVRGSRGINVDANPNLIEAFRRHRSEDINLNVGVGPESGSLEFYFIDDWSGRNTFRRELAEEFVRQHPDFRIQKVQSIPVVTLNSIVAEHASGRFPDLLSIDAEGMDYDILRSASFNQDRPMVICTEAEIDSEPARLTKLNDLMTDRGYRLYTRTVSNLIFVKARALERLGSAGGLTPAC